MPDGEMTWSAHPPSSASPPARTPNNAPATALPTGAPAPLADIADGSALRWVLDTEPLDLRQSRLEKWSHHQDHGTVDLTFILPADQSPTTGTPLRLTLHLDGAQQVTEAGTWDTTACHPTMHVDNLHWVQGTMTIQAWTLTRRGIDDFDRTRWELQVEQPETIVAHVERLDLARPPYLLLMAEVFTDGIWDLTTGDATIKTDIDLDDLALSDDLKHQIRAWNDAWFNTTTRAEEQLIDAQAQALASAIEAELPGTSVCAT